jgi:hypothetical protein
MSWNDGEKRDWDGSSGIDQSVDLELTDDTYGSLRKRVCLGGGQDEDGSGPGDWEWPEFAVDFPLLGDQVMDMGDGEDVVRFGMWMSSRSQMQRVSN